MTLEMMRVETDSAYINEIIASLINYLNSYAQRTHELESELKRVVKKLSLSCDNFPVKTPESEILASFESLGAQELSLGKVLNEYMLTSRELQILEDLVLGKTSKHIAKGLGISFRTVDFHITKLKLKMGANTRSDVIEKVVNLLNTQENV